ncbi:MAG TPA: DNA-directed RNA polymerase subunit H [Methanospirillum sp.]|nr:DNA-directed RNA polymerase subunit H [Methanospirillum sp.]
MNAEVNVLRHEMVPEHSIMSEEDVKSLYSMYSIGQEHLPKIYHDDPAVSAIGAKINDVIKIVRKSMTAGRAESYRQVVKRPKK